MNSTFIKKSNQVNINNTGKYSRNSYQNQKQVTIDVSSVELISFLSMFFYRFEKVVSLKFYSHY